MTKGMSRRKGEKLKGEETKQGQTQTIHITASPSKTRGHMQRHSTKTASTEGPGFPTARQLLCPRESFSKQENEQRPLLPSTTKT